MKKRLVLLLCACALFVFPAAAFAADFTDYTADDWKLIYSDPEPRYEDYEDSEEYSAAWDAWNVGFSHFIIATTQTEYARRAREAAQALPETAPVKSIESEGSNNGDSNPGLANDFTDRYPVGSYVDPSGAVWSPDGARLSPVPEPGTVLASDPDQASELPVSQSGDPLDLSPAVDSDTLAVIAGLVSDIAADPPVWYVEDLRPANPPAAVLEGLKALVTSIFGEYSPVTTTSVVIESVGNDTYQYLVETVAPGAAGVDYEWLAGVFLFGILLFCFMKLLGGILK